MQLLRHSFTRTHSHLPLQRVLALPWSRKINLLKFRRRQQIRRRPRTRSRACSPEQPSPARLRRARNIAGFPKHGRRTSLGTTRSFPRPLAVSSRTRTLMRPAGNWRVHHCSDARRPGRLRRSRRHGWRNCARVTRRRRAGTFALLYPRLLQRCEGYIYNDGPRRLVRHDKDGPQSREVSAHALDALVQPNLARVPGSRGKPLENCIVSQLTSARKRIAVADQVGKGFRRISASPAASVTGAPTTRPV